MEIKEMENKEQWENFVASFEMAQFLQSWQWGEFQQKLGRKIFRLVLWQDKKIIGVALLIKMLLPVGKSYFYCPRGPLIINSKEQTLNIFFKKIKEIAQKEKSIFFRFEPPVIENYKFSQTKSESFFSGKIKNYRKVADVQPSQILLLDLTKSEEEILEVMHPKTRYNIRLAKRKGVVVRQGEGDKDIEAFVSLTLETAERDGFRSHPANHYRKLLSLNHAFVKLFFAEHKNKVLAANLMINFGDTCTYSHGASSNQYKNLMAPHLLHWYCLCQAKRAGYKYYDFGGADEKKWPGVTRFKRSFVNQKTGLEISYPGTFDLPLDKKWYWLYSIAKKFI